VTYALVLLISVIQIQEDASVQKIAEELIVNSASHIHGVTSSKRDANNVIVILLDQLNRIAMCIRDNATAKKDLLVKIVNIVRQGIMDIQIVISVIVIREDQFLMNMEQFIAMIMDSVRVGI
jgi:hypothetical protein